MEFLMILLVFPISSFLFGIIGQIILKNAYLVAGTTFIIWLILTFILFNESFLIWVFIYTILSVIGSLLAVFLKKALQK